MLKNRSKASATEKRQTSINGQAIIYTLRRSFRARRVRLEISHSTGLIVIVPRSYPAGRLPSLIKSKERWIARHLTRLSRYQPPQPPKKLKTGDTVPYLGRKLKLMKQENHLGECVVLQGNELALNPYLFANGLLETSLEKWYRAEAARLINDMAERLSSQMGIHYQGMLIRGQKTRWGSCSQKKNLSLNWKLVMAPQPVIEYVIIHELLHLKEMNHSKRFWELVAQYCPNWREHKKWLKEHETELTSALRSSSEPATPQQLRLI
jgi:predicted metal-dependent hydrolase